jgi:hypothetical protein
MAPGIRTVRDEMYETHTRFEDIVDLARREGRDLTAEEDQEAAALTRRMKLLQSKLPQSRDVVSDLTGAFTPAAVGGVAAGETWGTAFVRSAEFRGVQARLPMSGPRPSIGPLEIKAAALRRRPEAGRRVRSRHRHRRPPPPTGPCALAICSDAVRPREETSAS